MNEKKAEWYVLLVVVAVASLAILTFFTSALTSTRSDESLTGAAIITGRTTLCKDSDGINPERNGIVIELYGYRFPDQCYDDKATTKSPVNNGRYLRETICEDNEPFYKVYDCGKNKCQYGACVSIGYSLVK
ncbi:MAG: hypothetical protein AABX98_06610 [Nanoarchaeota archaeon]